MTTSNATLPLSIGLPVYNGDEFLAEALSSILDQDFGEFELIICDNASTDRTESICRDFERRDDRIRYFRNPENIGASGNWNRVLELATGEYFKWIAHDDLHEPGFLSSCLAILERDPQVVVAFARAVSVDASGRRLREWGSHPETCSDRVETRYARLLAAAEDPLPLPIFGIMRADVLRMTRRFRSYPEADIALLAELSLHGRFAEVRRPLFLQREHGGRAGHKLSSDPYKAAEYWDPLNGKRMYFPHWSLLAGHLAGLRRAPLSSRERGKCLLTLGRWARRQRSLLLGDVIMASTRLPVFGPSFGRLHRELRGRAWQRRVGRVARDLEALIPPTATFILVDDGAFGDGMISDRHVRPFLEGTDGYAGPPADDETAVRELERMRREGAAYLAFGWPCFWWLTYYRGFVQHLNENFSRVVENDRLVVFDLRS